MPLRKHGLPSTATIKDQHWQGSVQNFQGCMKRNEPADADFLCGPAICSGGRDEAAPFNTVAPAASRPKG